MLEINDELRIPESEWTWTYARAGGPGGQNVNKVSSKAMLRWQLDASPSIPEPVKARLKVQFPSYVTLEGEFLITSQKHRDQERNREDCLTKLATMLRKALKAPVIRKITKPTAGAKRRRLADKKHQSDRKAQRKGSDGE